MRALWFHLAVTGPDVIAMGLLYDFVAWLRKPMGLARPTMGQPSDSMGPVRGRHLTSRGCRGKLRDSDDTLRHRHGKLWGCYGASMLLYERAMELDVVVACLDAIPKGPPSDRMMQRLNNRRISLDCNGIVCGRYRISWVAMRS